MNYHKPHRITKWILFQPKIKRFLKDLAEALIILIILFTLMALGGKTYPY